MSDVSLQVDVTDRREISQQMLSDAVERHLLHERVVGAKQTMPSRPPRRSVAHRKNLMYGSFSLLTLVATNPLRRCCRTRSSIVWYGRFLFCSL